MQQHHHANCRGGSLAAGLVNWRNEDLTGTRPQSGFARPFPLEAVAEGRNAARRASAVESYVAIGGPLDEGLRLLIGVDTAACQAATGRPSPSTATATGFRRVRPAADRRTRLAAA